MRGFSRHSQPVHLALPDAWPAHVRSALVHAFALAHLGMTHVRGWCADSRIARVRLVAECDRLRAEVGLLREELRIKDARMARIAPRERPHYPPVERLAILQLRAARAWSAEQAARCFLLTGATIASWNRRLDEQGPRAIVQLPVPVNRFPDFVGHLVQQLKTLCPTMGKKRIAQTLARAGLHLAVTTVGRMRKNPPNPAPTPAPQPKSISPRTVTAKYPAHVWNIDFTTVPTSAGFWVPWLPFAMLQRWPFCWWTAIVMDHFSRAVVGFALFRSQPSAAQLCDVLDRAAARAGAPPKYTVSDQGSQFQKEYRQWCARHGVKPRFGAVGRYGSIAVIERFMRTLKSEGLRRILVPLGLSEMRQATSAFIRWYNECRPHSSLAGATPREVYERRSPANRRPRFEPRARYPGDGACAAPRVAARVRSGAELRLVVSQFEGAEHLPVVDLERAA